MAVGSSPELWAAAGTSFAALLATLADKIASHRKEKRRDAVRSSQNGVLTRLENGLHSIQKDIQSHGRRIDMALHLLTGSPDGDGPNGHRAALLDHEQRLRELEQQPRKQ